MRVTDAFAIFLIGGGASAFVAAEAALARADDVRAVYWIAVGAAALYSCMRITRPRPNA